MEILREKNSIVLTSNMAALSRDRKPRIGTKSYPIQYEQQRSGDPFHESPDKFSRPKSCFMFAAFTFKIKVSKILKMIGWRYQLTMQNWTVCKPGTVLLFNRFWFQNLPSNPKAAFTFKIKVSKILKMIGWRYQLTMQNWTVCKPGTVLLFNRFWFQNLPSNPKKKETPDRRLVHPLPSLYVGFGLSTLWPQHRGLVVRLGHVSYSWYLRTMGMNSTARFSRHSSGRNSWQTQRSMTNKRSGPSCMKRSKVRSRKMHLSLP